MEGPALRVLLYSHSLPPWVDGVSTRMTSHLQLLREEGHQVHALTIEPEPVSYTHLTLPTKA